MEELAVKEQWQSNNYSITCLVLGCPKLKMLHVGNGATIESLQGVLLGLPDLIEFKHPAMALALENIIQSGNLHKVSALCNLYIEDNGLWELDAAVGLRSGAVVLNHLQNITTLDIRGRNNSDFEAVASLIEFVDKLLFLTNLTLHNFRDCELLLAVAVKSLGHQFRLLDLAFKSHNQHNLDDNLSYPVGDLIEQCREIRVLRLRFPCHFSEERLTFLSSMYNEYPKYNYNTDDYGSKLSVEEITPFPYLQELTMIGVFQSNLKPAIFAALITSPALQHLRLTNVSNFTDHVLEAAWNYTNQEGDQLTFTSLRTVRLASCSFISSPFLNCITDEKVPLEFIEVHDCNNVENGSLITWHDVL